MNLLDSSSSSSICAKSRGVGGTKQRSVFGVARQLPWRAFLDPTVRREVRVDETGALMRWRQVAAWMSHLPSSPNCGHAPETPDN